MHFTLRIKMWDDISFWACKLWNVRSSVFSFISTFRHISNEISMNNFTKNNKCLVLCRPKCIYTYIICITKQRFPKSPTFLATNIVYMNIMFRFVLIYVWQQARHSTAGDNDFVLPLNAFGFQCLSNFWITLYVNVEHLCIPIVV